MEQFLPMQAETVGLSSEFASVVRGLLGIAPTLVSSSCLFGILYYTTLECTVCMNVAQWKSTGERKYPRVLSFVRPSQKRVRYKPAVDVCGRIYNRCCSRFVISVARHLR